MAQVPLTLCVLHVAYGRGEGFTKGEGNRRRIQCGNTSMKAKKKNENNPREEVHAGKKCNNIEGARIDSAS